MHTWWAQTRQKSCRALQLRSRQVPRRCTLTPRSASIPLRQKSGSACAPAPGASRAEASPHDSASASHVQLLQGAEAPPSPAASDTEMGFASFVTKVLSPRSRVSMLGRYSVCVPFDLTTPGKEVATNIGLLKVNVFCHVLIISMRLQVLDSSLQTWRGFCIASTALADRVRGHGFTPVLLFSTGAAYCLARCKAKTISRKPALQSPGNTQSQHDLRSFPASVC